MDTNEMDKVAELTGCASRMIVSRCADGSLWFTIEVHSRSTASGRRRTWATAGSGETPKAALAEAERRIAVTCGTDCAFFA